jgi:hypothetical protein
MNNENGMTINFINEIQSFESEKNEKLTKQRKRCSGKDLNVTDCIVELLGRS